MTVSAGTDATYKKARIKLQDAQQQTIPISFYLVNYSAESDATLKTAFGTFLADLEAQTNCKVLSATLESVVATPFTSDKTPGTANFATVDNVLALNFQRANPLVSTGVVNKTFPIPAYIVGTASGAFPNAGVPNESGLANVITFLEHRLAFKYSGDGLIYTGFTYIQGDSQGISLPDLVDNL